jgi:hypothetical protein
MPTNNTEQTNFSLDPILSRFPTQKDTVNEFYENSPTFREICADYAEMVTWIEKYCQSEKQASKNCEYAQELLIDLEAEIIDCLKRNNKLVNDESMSSKGE